MLRKWIKRHRNFLLKKGGLAEKKFAISQKITVSTQILEQLNKRFTVRDNPAQPELPLVA